MRTSNPALNNSTFESLALGTDKPMTLQGTVNKTLIFMTLVVGAATFTWNRTLANPDSAPLWIGIGAITGLILCLITVFKKEWSPVTGSLYALAEGLFIGALSAKYSMYFEGIVMQASLITFGVVFAMLAAYSTRLIRATENFKLGVVAATGGIMIVYLATFVLGMFGINIPFIHDSGLIGIGFSVFVVIIAAMNLVLDFDFIETGVEQGAPKYMEWYAAFGLLVTLIWLYVEVLRLLAKLAISRD